jgi:plasmid replication initiation protein
MTTRDAGPFEALARTFMTPAKSGVYLTRNELLVLARLTEASVRINERPRMLVDILRSAQTADELIAMVERLADFTRAQLAQYEALASEYPSTAPAWRPWIERARRTLLLLDDTRHDIAL